MRRRLLSAASTLAFGLGVTMAGSLGITRGIGGTLMPASATLILPRRDAFAAPSVPREPLGRPAPTGPPGARVSRVALPPLPRHATPPARVTVRGFMVLVARLLVVLRFPPDRGR
jgi:hypothetical protein